MAENKKTTTKSSKSTTKKTTVWSLNKISMYTICAVAILYLVAMIFSLVGLNSKLVSALQGFATAIMICIVAVLAWRYVAKKPTVWKVLYVVC